MGVLSKKKTALVIVVGSVVVAGVALYLLEFHKGTPVRDFAENTAHSPIPSVFLEPSFTPSPTQIASAVSVAKVIGAHPTSTATSSPTNTPVDTSTPTPAIDPCGHYTKTSYDNTIMADSPVAYFPFNESEAICDHGPGHFFGYENVALTATTLPNGDRALTFDGSTSDYITVPDAEALSVPTTGKLTVEAWIRPDTLQFSHQEGSGYVHWMGKGETNKFEYAGRMYSLTNSENRPNRISGYAFNLTGGLGVGSYFQDTITAGDWIHYVLVINTVNTSTTYPTGYTKIYKNGAQRDQDTLNTLSIVPGNSTAPFRIGTRDLASFFQGAIGKVAIYNYELSPFQVLAHYQKMVPPVSGTAAYVQNVGQVSTKTTGTTMQITVSHAVPVGHTLIARVLADFSAAGPTMTDSKGNTYTRDRTAPNSGNTIRASIFSSPITTALATGDTITITTASVAARAAVVDEFSGLLSSSFVDQQNGTSGSSTTPGTSISINTTQANELIVGFVGVEGTTDEDSYTEDQLGQFSSLPREGTFGGVDDTNVTVNGGFKSVGVTGNYKYQPTLDPSRNWIDFIVSYKAS